MLSNVQKVTSGLKASCSKYNRDINGLKLLAVSKTHPASAIQAAYDAGITDFGESYLQESLEKIHQLGDLPICWHFIGPIQSNKTRQIAENFDWVHSVDREKVLRRLASQRPANLPPLNVCLQTNLFNEPQKQGVTEPKLAELLELALSLPHIKLRGLMVIPPKNEDFDQQRQQFKQVKRLFSDLKGRYPEMDTLSMGMSGDSEAAIAEGSTMVRIGTAIFGQRQVKT